MDLGLCVVGQIHKPLVDDRLAEFVRWIDVHGDLIAPIIRTREGNDPKVGVERHDHRLVVRLGTSERGFRHGRTR